MLKVEDRRTPLAWQENGAGQAILFVHAFPLNGAMWASQLSALPEGWRGIAPDLPGFGGTSPWTGPPSIDRYADDLIGLLDSQAIERAVVCGLSMGGYVALSMIRRYSDRVRALVLCDTRSEADNDATRRGRLETMQGVREEGMQPLMESMLPKLISRVTRLARPQIAERVTELMGETNPEGAAAALMAMAQRPDSSALLRDITVPTLIIVGAEDEITPPGESQMLARGIRGARIEVIDQAGHLSNMEQPAAFNAALRAFLSALPHDQTG